MSESASSSRAPRRVIRFREGLISRDVKAFNDKALPAPGRRLDAARRSVLEQLLRETEGCRFSRVFRSVTPDALDDLVARARARDRHYEPPDFLSYFFFDAPPSCQPSKHNDLFRDKRFDGLIASAGWAPTGCSPTIHPNLAGARWNINRHFHKAPFGTGAEHAWTHVAGGGDGTGIRFADVEAMAPIPHAGLKLERVELLGDAWDEQTAHKDHATAVLGVVLANEADGGAIGAAPNVESAVVVSNHGEDGHDYTADAVAKAATKLRRGDVLLIEYQCGAKGYHPDNGRSIGVPVEFDAIVCEAIEAATKAGIVVIEPGGNGDNAQFGLDLDTLARGDDTNLRRGDADFIDSGAIVVSAARIDETEKNRRLEWAPYGSRVDCYARGSAVMTCRKGGGDPSTAVLKTFGGTSAAAAIIAGTALQVQGIALRKNNAPLDPEVLRELFADSQNGTDAEDENPKRHIGPMPDLEKLLERLPSAII